MARFQLKTTGTRLDVIDNEHGASILNTDNNLTARGVLDVLNGMEEIRREALVGHGTSPSVLATMRVMADEVVSAHVKAGDTDPLFVKRLEQSVPREAM